MTEVGEQHHSGRRESPLTTAAARDLWLFAWLSFAVLAVVARSRQPGGDWSVFEAAARTLASGRWMYVYVDHPHAQTGPITIALAWLVEPLGLYAVRLAIMLAGIAIMGLLVWSSRGLPNVRPRLAIGGTALALWWPQLSYFGHLDDAVVASMAVVAVVLARRRATTEWQGALAGVAIGVKPTAVFMLAFAMPTSRWRRWRSWTPLAIGLVIAAAIWLPFMVVDGARDALRPEVVIQPDSVLALFVQSGGFPSPVLRLVQLATTLACAVAANRRRGAAAVLWASVAARLLLDPAAWPYYTAGFVLGALVWETYNARRLIPWATLASALLLAPRWMIHSDTARAWMRLVACLGALVLVFAGDRLARRMRPSSGTAALSEAAPRRL